MVRAERQRLRGAGSLPQQLGDQRVAAAAWPPRSSREIPHPDAAVKLARIDNRAMKPSTGSNAGMRRYRVGPGIMVREIDGEIVALDSQAKLIHQLNGVASLIWRLVAEGRTPEAIVEAIVAEYDVGRDTAAKDVEETLERLRSVGLLVLE
jgi:hypothetical protein